jgi:hypothetical protein
MKSMRIVGFCLLSMFAMSMALAGTAQAKWEQCSEGPSGVAPTKYKNHLCEEAAPSNAGEWQWNEVKGTEEGRIKGSLRLADTNTLAGEAAVECSGESIGDIGPGQFARIQEVKTEAKQCRPVKVCENVEEFKALNLPWQVEAYNTEGKHLAKLLGTVAGKEPGYLLKCKAPLIGSITDECVQEEGKPESILLENKATGTELLVLATFQHLRKAKCTQGGAESGAVTGSVAILKANGWGLRIA